MLNITTNLFNTKNVNFMAQRRVFSPTTERKYKNFITREAEADFFESSNLSSLDQEDEKVMKKLIHFNYKTLCSDLIKNGYFAGDQDYVSIKNPQSEGIYVSYYDEDCLHSKQKEYTAEEFIELFNSLKEKNSILSPRYVQDYEECFSQLRKTLIP